MTKAAFDHPPTDLGHKKLVIKRWIWLIFTSTAAIAAGSLCTVEKSWELAALSLFFFSFMLPLTVIALQRTRRVAQILRTYPWQAYACSYPPRALDRPTVIRIGFSEQHTPVLRITPFSVELARKQNSQPDMIWFAGDPRFGGVVSPVGGHFPVRVVPEDMGDGAPQGTAEDDALAEKADLVKEGKVRKT
ncbi:hypothetical protein [Streptomyces sp. SP18CS02]|uniref:hypothetical protein n=1 Tax=Streptomyces sp. SP18CS02 TaxID=3002531 RepID=UPI002E783A51|nr:hypothetical protein [Streptomyces sp. SP18CS02]MEE1754042.1 hypothetical protein [Streptomyces sp. SP18CS02]